MRKLATLIAIAALALPFVALAQPPFGGPGDGPDGAAKRHRRGPSPQTLGRLLELSDEQVADIEALFEQHRSEWQPLREERQALHAELEELLDDPAVEAAAVGALVLQLRQARDESAAAREELKGQVAELLTPDQLERWETLESARSVMREERRDRRRGPSF